MTSSSDGKMYIAKIRRNLCILIALSAGVEILDVYFSSTTAYSIIIIGYKETTQHQDTTPIKTIMAVQNVPQHPLLVPGNG